MAICVASRWYGVSILENDTKKYFVMSVIEIALSDY